MTTRQTVVDRTNPPNYQAYRPRPKERSTNNRTQENLSREEEGYVESTYLGTFSISYPPGSELTWFVSRQKTSAGLTMKTERNLAERAGHLELLAGGKASKKKEGKEGKDADGKGKKGGSG